MSVPNDFESRFCQRFEVPAERYARELVSRSLYPHARCCMWLLQWLASSYMQADYDFVYDVARITRFREYETAVRAYFDHPMNQNNALRRRLFMRISTSRMRRLVREVIEAK
jgi:hypothetical protein